MSIVILARVIVMIPEKSVKFAKFTDFNGLEMDINWNFEDSFYILFGSFCI